MKKGLTFLFAMLLMIGAVAAPSVMADPPASKLLKPTLVCSDGNSDVNLQVRVYNQGPGDIPANSTITYSYKTSASGPMKSGSYKLDGPIPQGESRTITVSPLTHWNPPIYQCTASVFTFKKLPKVQ